MRLRAELLCLAAANKMIGGVLFLVFFTVFTGMYEPVLITYGAENDTPLSSIKNKHNAINFWIADDTQYPLYYNEDGEVKGYYYEFINKLEDELEIPFKRIETASASEATELLEQGKLSIIFGLNDEIAGQEGITASKPIYTNSIVAITLPDSEEITPNMVKSCYWGIEELWLKALSGTPFMDHTVDSISQNELYDLLKYKDVYGILVKKSTIDYDMLIRKHLDYKMVKDIQISFNECLLLNSSNTELNKYILEAVSTYSDELRATYEYEPLSSYINLLGSSKRELKDIKEKFMVLGVLTVILTVSAICLTTYLVVRLRTEKRQVDQLHGNDTEKSLFELNIKKKTLSSIHGFGIFGLSSSEYGDVMKLEELSNLTGFDFISHYDDILHDRMKQYQRRFILYKSGKKQFIAENGCIERNHITITLTDVSLSKGREGEVL